MANWYDKLTQIEVEIALRQCGCGGNVDKILIRDSFDRSDSQELGKADTGQSYEQYPAGNFGILDNALHANTGRLRPSSMALISDRRLTTDHTVELTLRKVEVDPRYGHMQVVFRGVDADNNFRFGADTGYGGHYRLVHRLSGKDTVIFTDNNASLGRPVDGDVVKVVCSEEDMTCYVNDKLIVQAKHSGLWGTVTDNMVKVGVSMQDVATDILVDDLVAYNTEV